MTDSHKAITPIPTASLATVEHMSPIVQAGLAILQANPDPATLRELLAVQREWEAGEAKRAFTRAMVGLKADLPESIARDATVDYTSAKGRTHYTHSSLAGAAEAIIPHLTAHGFSHAWTPSNTEKLVTVTCRLTHRDGHHTETTISAPPDNSGNKSAPQAVASTITLLSRYSLLSLLGIATRDMVEPTHKRDSSPGNGTDVDSKRNLKAMARLARDYKRTRAEAEAFVGRPVPEWTGADLERISEWVAEPAPEPDLASEAAAHDEEMTA